MFKYEKHNDVFNKMLGFWHCMLFIDIQSDSAITRDVMDEMKKRLGVGLMEDGWQITPELNMIYKGFPQVTNNDKCCTQLSGSRGLYEKSCDGLLHVGQRKKRVQVA